MEESSAAGVDFKREATKRLRGTWRSDRAKTTSYWVYPKRLATQRLKFWKGIFGKMTCRITPTRIYTECEGRKSVSRYEILWADQWSVILLIGEGSSAKARQLFFDGDYFYTLASRTICEYFKRVED